MEHKPKVVISDKESSTKEVKYRVPHNSVLGSVLFQIYIVPMRGIALCKTDTVLSGMT